MGPRRSASSWSFSTCCQLQVLGDTAAGQRTQRDYRGTFGACNKPEACNGHDSEAGRPGRGARTAKQPAFGRVRLQIHNPRKNTPTVVSQGACSAPILEYFNRWVTDRANTGNTTAVTRTTDSGKPCKTNTHAGTAFVLFRTPEKNDETDFFVPLA